MNRALRHYIQWALCVNRPLFKLWHLVHNWLKFSQKHSLKTNENFSLKKLWKRVLRYCIARSVIIVVPESFC